MCVCVCDSVRGMCMCECKYVWMCLCVRRGYVCVGGGCVSVCNGAICV